LKRYPKKSIRKYLKIVLKVIHLEWINSAKKPLRTRDSGYSRQTSTILSAKTKKVSANSKILTEKMLKLSANNLREWL